MRPQPRPYTGSASDCLRCSSKPLRDCAKQLCGPDTQKLGGPLKPEDCAPPSTCPEPCRLGERRAKNLTHIGAPYPQNSSANGGRLRVADATAPETDAAHAI